MFTMTPHPVIPTHAPERSGLARLWYQLGRGSTERQERARVEAWRTAALRELWQQACHHSGLGLMMYTPSGIVVSAPRLARVDFGPPVSFTVCLRPGQDPADLRAARPWLSRALGVADLRIDECAPGWVTVVVVGPGHDVDHADDLDVTCAAAVEGPGEGPRVRRLHAA